MSETKSDAPRVIIPPTVGRVVWFYPNEHDPVYVAGYVEPYAAMVAGVHSDRLVSLGVLDRNGSNHARIRVVLVQDGDDKPLTPNGSGPASYCAWMPFQKGQAAKAEAKVPPETDADAKKAAEEAELARMLAEEEAAKAKGKGGADAVGK